MKSPSAKGLIRWASNLIHQVDGPLTQQLLRTPGEFGLGQVPAAQKPTATTSLTCGYCSTGCSLTAHLKDGEAINLSPNSEYPVNLGMACPKGWEALTPMGALDRGTTPLLRSKAGRMEAIDWHDAMTTFTDKFKEIGRKHGQDSIAFLGTGQITTEEMALLGSLAKFGMGMVHGDGNTRQCMATAVAAYKQSFGFDAPPYTYQDFEESDVIILIGSNLCIAHPIMWERISRNKNNPKVIVIDPRKTETASAATHHLAIYPKSDLVLFYGLANILINENWTDNTFIEKHTDNFEEFRKFVSQFSIASVSEATGIEEPQLFDLAKTIHASKATSFWWTMGVNQSHEGVRVAQSVINIALMTGNIGRPGTGANSITGQANAMGSRLFSNTSSLLGGHDFKNAEHRKKVAQHLDIPETSIPTTAGMAYDQIVEGILSGKIKGLWVIATNPAHSWIHQGNLRDILGRLDFLVVQDLYPTTETSQYADLYFPSAGWGEKEGTFINSERRIGLLKKVIRAPGKALSDFYIFKLVAEYWGCGDLFTQWSDPESTFQILRKITKDQPCDITGIEDYAQIDTLGGIQWPHPEGSKTPNPQRRLFEDNCFFHANKRAYFHFETPRDIPEKTNEEFPFLLLTGRGSSSQWHTQTRTSKSPVLRNLYPNAVYAEINPLDAERLGIQRHSEVRILSRRGSVRAKAFLTTSIQEGHIFMPMHYEETNVLTHASFDPYSRQPSYKASAVNIRPLQHWE
ncbi:MAG: nitrate reductase [Myxococcota bacterium]|nr:nitrate reductase [Myxococcota bacterium]